MAKEKIAHAQNELDHLKKTGAPQHEIDEAEERLRKAQDHLPENRSFP
jgi:hypothetical protein